MECEIDAGRSAPAVFKRTGRSSVISSPFRFPSSGQLRKQCPSLDVSRFPKLVSRCQGKNQEARTVAVGYFSLIPHSE